jgi:polar amino acid transport system substrate-binding protein
MPMFARIRSAARRGLFSLCLLLPVATLAGTLDEILERGVVRVGVSAFVPWTMESPAGDLRGFEIDVARKLAADIGVEPQFVMYEWDQIIPAVRRGDIDVVAAGMGVTPARALQVAFSLPYSESGVTLVANKERTADVASMDDLNAPGVPVVTVGDTMAGDVAVRMFGGADLRIERTPDLAEASVLSGEAAIYVTSLPEANFLALSHPDIVDIPIAKPLIASEAAFAVAPDAQRWLNFLNAWVTSRTADGWIPTTHHYWFESLEWTDDEP